MMRNQKTQSKLDNPPYYADVCNLVESGETNTGIVKVLSQKYSLETSPDSIRRFRKRHSLFIPTADRSGTNVEGDQATLTTPGYSGGVLRDALSNPDSMIRERGLDPEEWLIDGVTVNEWDGPSAEGSVVTYKQAKLVLRRKKPECLVKPARSDGWSPTRSRNTPRSKEFASVVLVGDQQAPFHDRGLHGAFISWLDENRPDSGVLIGDTVDFDDVSRHRLDPENTANVNECIQSGYDLLRDYVHASPRTFWKKLLGNHDERIRNFVIDQARALYGLKRATDGMGDFREDVLDVGFLMRLDELGIDLIKPNGGYDQAQVQIAENLAVRHGWVTRKGSGATALATLDTLGYNVVVGHNHRQGVVHRTTHDIHGHPKTIVGVEAGCMCSIGGGLSDGRVFPAYTVNPDWQNGFAVATIWDDGRFHIDLATYVDGILFYRDQRHS